MMDFTTSTSPSGGAGTAFSGCETVIYISNTIGWSEVCATAVQEADPGARLAFRIYRQDENEIEIWSTYASNDSTETSY